MVELTDKEIIKFKKEIIKELRKFIKNEIFQLKKEILKKRRMDQIYFL